MKFRPTNRHLILASMLLSALVGTVFWTVRFSTNKIEHRHTILSLLRSAAEYNHALNENVLRAHAFITNSYDPIVTSTESLKKVCQKLITSFDGSTKAETDLLKAANEYCQLVENKLAMVERFKSTNSILKNSLRYLSVLIEKYKDVAARMKAEQLFNGVHLLRIFADERLHQEVKSQLDHFKSMAMKSRLDLDQTLSQHLEIVLNTTMLRRQIEMEILSGQSEHAYSNLRDMYDRWNEQTERTMAFYYGMLSFAVFGMALSLVYLFKNLQRTTLLLANLNETLESKVKTRTAELSDALSQLEEKQLLLMQTAKMSALGEMAGGIAHEINTPLSAIMMNADMLSDYAKDGSHTEIVENVDSIVSIVNRISKIISGLRRFSRDTAHDECVPVPIGNIIKDTLALCHQRFTQNNVDL